MRLTLFAAGSQGDVQPGIRVGRGLRCAGYNVRLAAPQNFAEAVHGQGLCFQPLPGDVQQIMASEAGRKFMEIGGPNPFQSIRAMRQMLGPVAQQMAEGLLETCRDTDALITLAVFAPFGKTVAELRRIPLINFEPTPVLPTRAFAAPGWPVQKNLGGAFNLCSGWVMLYVLWQWYHPSLNAFRQRHGLRAMHFADFHQSLTASPLLGVYSSAVIPRPADWPKAVHITGYWSDEALPARQPSVELETFLDSGEPPVYVGFGSMAGRQPERITRIVLEALEKSGQRGVLATGWGGLKAMKVPANIFVLDSAPHSWLFPHMKAVVHHGGAGTTAAGLQAGKPTLIVPFIVDQPFWGERVRALGVGPAPIPAKNISATNLAEALEAVTKDSRMQSRAEAISRAMRAENGVNAAVNIVNQYLQGSG